MSRDPAKLDVFHVADALAIRVYHATHRIPVTERYGMQAQIRRAAVSVPCNIVEGCARRTPREYLHFINIALASATEVRYLIDLAQRLEMFTGDDISTLVEDYLQLLKKLQKLLNAIGAMRP